ncbi:MAG: GDP-mannose 4,6-dehydratase [Armatimonadetes bacterium]|nr:GDP-mannose 4,6-dehydratase [Armatimonadota bacterium]
MHPLSAFYKDKSALITGGLGFLGSNLAHSLVTLGARVTLSDALLPLYGGNMHNVRDIRKEVHLEFCDIRDSLSMERLVRGQDVIFHIAGQTSHVDSMTEPLLDEEINCKGNLVFLEACRKWNPNAKIVYAGTRGQYGKLHSTPVREDHPMEPVDIYGINKLAGESYHLLYGRVHGLRVVSLRINNTYGPRHQMKHGKYGILNWFVRLALEDEAITVYGDGGQLRDYNYVDDVTEAFLLVGGRDEANGKAFNLGSGNPVRFMDMVKTLLSEAGSGRMVRIPWPRDRAAIEVGDYVADYSAIQSALGWEPRVGLPEGLKRTVEFYRQNKEFYW